MPLWASSKAARDGHVIVTTTNSGGLVLVTTKGRHGLATGEVVTLVATGDYLGDWFVTVTGAKTFTLNGSTFVANHAGGRWAGPIEPPALIHLLGAGGDYMTTGDGGYVLPG